MRFAGIVGGGSAEGKGAGFRRGRKWGVGGEGSMRVGVFRRGGVMRAAA